MMNERSLTQTLNSKLNNPIFDNTNKDWYMFINDHIGTILKNSKIVNISLEDKYIYQNNFHRYLRYIKINQQSDWIIMLLNDFKEIDEFVIRDFIYTIDTDYLTQLYRQFKTSQKLK